MLPPGRSFASSTCTSMPRCWSWNASANPEMAAPTTATCVWAGSATGRSTGFRSTLDRTGEGLLGVLVLQILIEGHRDVADEDTADARALDAGVGPVQEAIALVHLQRVQLRAEVAPKV